jgi:chromosome segregation ATPase
MRNEITIILLTVILAGCCSGTQDPRSGGFFGGLQGIFCGDYQKRIEERQAELSRQREITNELQAESNKREQEYQLKISELNSEKQRREEMEKYIKALSADISRLNAKDAGERKKITDLKNEINQVQTELDNLKSNEANNDADPEKYLMLEKKRDHLAEEYKALLDYFNALSNTAN